MGSRWKQAADLGTRSEVWPSLMRVEQLLSLTSKPWGMLPLSLEQVPLTASSLGGTQPQPGQHNPGRGVLKLQWVEDHLERTLGLGSPGLPRQTS